MTDNQHHDVVTVGAGAGGGTHLHRLAGNGVKMLRLERGPFLPRERASCTTQPVFVCEKWLVDVNYTAHDRDSLYVADTSSFRNIGVINPSLTAIAKSIRIGDHITERRP
jgi:choline dehydrogenase-like flavoprotein